MSPQASAPVSDLETGDAVGTANLIGKLVDRRFRVVSLIGSGAMADVYEVEHTELGRRLALKVLRPRGQEAAGVARRFKREARALSRINSEHVVSIFDYGALPDGAPFFVMELLRGQSLRAVLEAERELAVVRACNLAIDVCLGLHASHQAGLVHRDLKPENLWLTRRDDGREACILLDFGVVSLAEAHTTVDGALVGTACYMSPEQIAADASPGPESDVFALGVVAYECLSGRSPFAADSLERTLFRVLNQEPAPLPELNAAVPAELWEVLSRALRKQSDQRFGSALELAHALLPFAGPARRLPVLGAGSDLAASSHPTLADAESLGAAVLISKHGARSPKTRGKAGVQLGALLAVAFAAGLGVQRLATRSPATEVAPRVSAASDERSSPVTSSPANPPGASLPLGAASSVAVAPAAPTSEPAVSPQRGARPVKPARAPAVAGSSAAPAASALPVPPPPQPLPRFDGTNPYRE